MIHVDDNVENNLDVVHNVYLLLDLNVVIEHGRRRNIGIKIRAKKVNTVVFVVVDENITILKNTNQVN